MHLEEKLYEQEEGNQNKNKEMTSMMKNDDDCTAALFSTSEYTSVLTANVFEMRVYKARVRKRQHEVKYKKVEVTCIY